MDWGGGKTSGDCSRAQLGSRLARGQVRDITCQDPCRTVPDCQGPGALSLSLPRANSSRLQPKCGTGAGYIL